MENTEFELEKTYEVLAPFLSILFSFISERKGIFFFFFFGPWRIVLSSLLTETRSFKIFLKLYMQNLSYWKSFFKKQVIIFWVTAT